MERRLSLPLNQQYAEKYKNIVNKLIKSGAISVISPPTIYEPEGMVWYLPHHFVEYPNKSEKISVVMDCAASFSQVLLNNQLFLGPPLLPKLVSVLQRSSKCLFALSADIAAFYHRVGIPAKH
jgi:hypothetical protein